MTSQYKVTYRYVENGLTKEDDEIIAAEEEPTQEEVQKNVDKRLRSGVGPVSIVSIAPYP